MNFKNSMAVRIFCLFLAIVMVEGLVYTILSAMLAA